MTDWKHESARLIRLVDPTEAGQPIYLFSADEVSGYYELDEHFSAIEADCLILRPAIQEWRCFGFCTVLALDKCPTPLDELTAIVAHEYCHFAQSSFARLVKYCKAAELLHLQATAPPVKPIHARWPVDRPWVGHAGDFIRLAVHFAHRARRLGWCADENDILTSQYTLSRASTYAKHLGDEVECLSGESLADVARIDPPSQYSEFCQRDLELAEHHFQPNQPEKINAIAVRYFDEEEQNPNGVPQVAVG